MKSAKSLLWVGLAVIFPHCGQGWGDFWQTSLALDRDEVNLLFGTKQQLQVTSTDAGSDFTWSVSDASKVKVSDSGELTALKTGTVTVTVKTRNQRRIGQAFVTVPRGQMLSIRGAVSAEAMLFNPLTTSFSGLPALTAASGNGASLWPITTGPHAGKILVIHGNALSSTSLFDPGTATFSSGPVVSGNVGAGAHAFAPGNDTVVVVLAGGSSTATSVYSMATHTFSAGPNLSQAVNAGAGSKSFPVTSGGNSGKFITVHGAAQTTTSLYNPSDNTYTAGPNLPSASAAGGHTLAITSGAAAGKTLFVHGNSSDVSLYNPVNNTFEVTGVSTNTTNNGASTFRINAGVHEGKFFTIHGNSQTFTSLSDVDLTGWTSSIATPSAAGSGAHVFRIAVGPNTGKMMVLFNITATTQIYDDATHSFSTGPTLGMGSAGLGSVSMEIP